MRGTTLDRRSPTRLGDLPRLSQPAWRTTFVRAGLAVALAATLAGAVLLARSAGSGRAAVLPVGAKTGVIVSDMSASVAGPTFERVATVVRGLVAANQAMGLVMFSDVAYELLPPNTPPSALQQFVRFFVPEKVTKGQPLFGQSPWSQFSGGTRISTGLIAGEQALRRAGEPHGALVLMSDLNDAQDDREPLVSEALALRKAHVPIRIVPLNASPQNVALFSQLFGSGVFVSVHAFRHQGKHRVLPVAAGSPWALLTVGLLFIGLLAANERLNARLVPESAA
ncbi:MAG TPA: vWA domain-containing protein [Gaiellaceae bacterium]|nr:vWA domain-containing protein [Gaiellaceae bacterium]